MKYDPFVEEFRTAGGVIEDNELVTSLLSTLPDKYDSVVTVLETMDTCLFDKTKALLLEREMMLCDKSESEKHHKETQSAAFQGNSNRKYNKNKTKSSRKQHKAMKCWTCKGDGHISPNFPTKGGDGGSGNSGSSFASFAFMTSGTTDNTVKFWFDSGVTEHLVTDRSWLTSEYKLQRPLSIDVAKDKTSLEVTHGGSHTKAA